MVVEARLEEGVQPHGLHADGPEGGEEQDEEEEQRGEAPLVVLVLLADAVGA